MFVDRHAELHFLDTMLQREHPGPAQLILLYGRRRIGKTFLLRHWVEGAGVPCTYWAAQKESALLQRSRLYARIAGVQQARFDSWADCWEAIANFYAGRRHILIIDEFSYAAEAEAGMLSSLQHAWDQLFQNSQLVLILCGSHVHAMEDLLTYQSPLFGRFTGQWCLRPLPYASLEEFFPTWSVEERVAGYAIVGGVPAYWTWLDREQSLLDNIHKMLTPGSPFLAEPAFLLYDELREPTSYLSVIRALGAGHHTLADLANATMIGSGHLSAYLARLQELHLVERRTPITVPPAQRDRSRQGRYHLLDPFFRFYFRFVAPYQEEVDYQPDRVIARIYDGLRAFVGATAFEELCRRWVLEQSQAGNLPVTIREVGSHWSRAVQADVVGLNWQEHHVLVGECKWGLDEVGREVVRDLVQHKGPQVIKHLPALGTGWKEHYVLFARAGFTPAARREAKSLGIRLIDATQLDADLRRVLGSKTAEA